MVSAVMSGARWVVNGANGYLAGTSPLVVAGGAILAWKALEQLSRLRDEGERERLWQAFAPSVSVPVSSSAGCRHQDPSSSRHFRLSGPSVTGAAPGRRRDRRR